MFLLKPKRLSSQSRSTEMSHSLTLPPLPPSLCERLHTQTGRSHDWGESGSGEGGGGCLVPPPAAGAAALRPHSSPCPKCLQGRKKALALRVLTVDHSLVSLPHWVSSAGRLLGRTHARTCARAHTLSNSVGAGLKWQTSQGGSL